MVGPRLLRTHDGRRPTAAQPLSFPHRLRLIGVFGASLFFAPRPGTMSTGSGSPVPGPWKARRGNPPGDPATVQGRPALEVFPAGMGGRVPAQPDCTRERGDPGQCGSQPPPKGDAQLSIRRGQIHGSWQVDPWAIPQQRREHAASSRHPQTVRGVKTPGTRALCGSLL